MQDLIAFIKDGNGYPVIETALQTPAAPVAKIPMELSAQIEAETRARTIVISGIEEADRGMDNSRLRFVKVVLTSTNHWRIALANARLLRSSMFSSVYIRRSMSSEESKREFELR
ncbi:hypothetical protein ANCCAN_14921 [Ancylostoma caninum]|uniref:Uncharacterized protein n=1 Tax=Ancylostoma caninum TaxID=29170 RepID=A0A368G840_ANCCA|nr:hypothetical protein ANCCAN_14921 [Ancylostoma caninum]